MSILVETIWLITMAYSHKIWGWGKNRESRIKGKIAIM